MSTMSTVEIIEAKIRVLHLKKKLVELEAEKRIKSNSYEFLCQSIKNFHKNNKDHRDFIDSIQSKIVLVKKNISELAQAEKKTMEAQTLIETRNWLKKRIKEIGPLEKIKFTVAFMLECGVEEPEIGQTTGTKYQQTLIHCMHGIRRIYNYTKKLAEINQKVKNDRSGMYVNVWDKEKAALKKLEDMTKNLSEMEQHIVESERLFASEIFDRLKSYKELMEEFEERKKRSEWTLQHVRL